MEHKTFTFEIKSVDYEGRTLEGYAAGIGNLDLGGDIIHPGAFRKTLIERGGKIKFLWQHDPTEPIGRLVEAREENNGLYVKAIISDTARGRDALALLRDGAIGEMSIGYDAVKGATDYSKTADGATVRNLREVKLYEFSLVTFPMNESARVTALKENGQPSEEKPYRNVPDDKIDEMDRCVEDVMGKGHDKPGAIAICYASIVEGKSLAESYYLNGFDFPDDVKAAMRTEADGQHPAGHYLVVEDPQKPSTWHLRVKGPDGKPDHRLMGAAWAALHGGYRGNAYEGPGKQEAISKLRAMYESEDLPIPGGKAGDPISQRKGTLYLDVRLPDNNGGFLIPYDNDEEYKKALTLAASLKVGRTISAATRAKLIAARDVLDELCNMGMIEMEDEEENKSLDHESKSAILNPGLIEDQPTTEYAAGPTLSPTDTLLKLIDLEMSDLHYRR